MIKKVVIADGEYGAVSFKAAARYKQLSGKDLESYSYSTYEYNPETQECASIEHTKWRAPQNREDPIWVQIIEEGFDNDLYSIDIYDDEYQDYDIDTDYIGYECEKLVTIPVINIDKLMSLQTRKDVEKYLNKLEVKYK